MWRKLTRDFLKRKLCLKSVSSNSTASTGSTQPRPQASLSIILYQNSVFSSSPSSGPEPSTRSFASSWPCSTLNRYVARALTDAASFAMLTCIRFDSASGPASRFHGRFAAAGKRQINTSLTPRTRSRSTSKPPFLFCFFKKFMTPWLASNQRRFQGEGGLGRFPIHGCLPYTGRETALAVALCRTA